MKKTLLPALLIISLLILSSSYIFSQEQYYDIVYLKDGHKIKGIVLEQSPGLGVKILLENNKTCFFMWKQVEKVVKEKKELVYKDSMLTEAGEKRGVLFVQGSLGYGIKSNTDRLVNYNLRSTSVFFDSFGKGLSVKAGLGYMFNDQFGLMGDVALISGTKIETRHYQSVPAYTSTYSPSAFYIQPSVLMNFLKYLNVSCHIKMGMVISIPVIGVTNRQDGNYDETSPREVEVEYKGAIALGFNTTIGCGIKIYDRFSFVTEINYFNLKFEPKDWYIRSFTINGGKVEIPNGYAGGSFNEKVYPYDQNTLLQESFSFCNIGLEAGLRYTL